MLGKSCQHLLAKPVAFPWQQSKHRQYLLVQYSLLILIHQPTSLFVTHAFLAFVLISLSHCPCKCSAYVGLQADARIRSDIVAVRRPIMSTLRKAVNGRAQKSSSCMCLMVLLFFLGRDLRNAHRVRARTSPCFVYFVGIVLSHSLFHRKVFRVMYINCPFIFRQF